MQALGLARWETPWGCPQAGNGFVFVLALLALGAIEELGQGLLAWGRLQAGQGCVFVFICCLCRMLSGEGTLSAWAHLISPTSKPETLADGPGLALHGVEKDNS